MKLSWLLLDAVEVRSYFPLLLLVPLSPAAASAFGLESMAATMEVHALGLPIEARIYLQHTRYAPKQQVAVTLNATEHDITFTDRPEFAYRNQDVAPVVSMNWLTSKAVEPLPGQTDFKTGFRVIFGAPAPAGAVLNYEAAIVP